MPKYNVLPLSRRAIPVQSLNRTVRVYLPKPKRFDIPVVIVKTGFRTILRAA